MNMQSVISESQAREITRGRKPLVPIVYEEAVKSLGECLSLDEAKTWNDKSDALAAWAKIYHDGEVLRKAKALKQLAFRRMYILAEQLRPTKKNGDGSFRHSGLPGAKSLLREKGLSASEASAAVKIGRLPEKEFKAHNNAPSPLSPTVLAYRLGQSNTSDAFREFLGSSGPLPFRSFCRGHDAKTLAKSLSGEEAVRARIMVTEIAEWCDEFERHLPRKKS